MTSGSELSAWDKSASLRSGFCLLVCLGFGGATTWTQDLWIQDKHSTTELPPSPTIDVWPGYPERIKWFIQQWDNWVFVVGHVHKSHHWQGWDRRIVTQDSYHKSVPEQTNEFKLPNCRRAKLKGTLLISRWLVDLKCLPGDRVSLCGPESGDGCLDWH